MNKKNVLTLVLGILLVIVSLVISLNKGKLSSLLPKNYPIASSLPTLSAMTVIINYTNKGFLPENGAVKRGTTVVFQNNSQSDMWPVSIKYKAYPEYPVKGDCGSSKFDSCGPITKGKSWSITLDQVGTWVYQDKATGKFYASIKVEP